MQIRVRSGHRRKYTHVAVILELRPETRAARLKALQPQPRSNFPAPIHITLLRPVLPPTVLPPTVLPETLLPRTSLL
jgi:hypothetical protein